VKQWIKWLAIGLFLAAIGIIQFIPDPTPVAPAVDDSPRDPEGAEG
jgi:hypothetical protein